MLCKMERCPQRALTFLILGNLFMLREINDETRLRLNDSLEVSSQSCKAGVVVLIYRHLYRFLNVSSTAKSQIKSQR